MMNKRELKELVALRAVEMFSLMNSFHDDVPSERILKPLKDAVDLWNPSIAECNELAKRLEAQETTNQ